MGDMLVLHGLGLAGDIPGIGLIGAIGAVIALAALGAVAAAAGTFAARLAGIDAGLRARMALGAAGLALGWLAFGLALSAAGLGASPAGPTAPSEVAETFFAMNVYVVLAIGGIALSWIVDLAIALAGALALGLIWRALAGR